LFLTFISFSQLFGFDSIWTSGIAEEMSGIAGECQKVQSAIILGDASCPDLKRGADIGAELADTKGRD